MLYQRKIQEKVDKWLLKDEIIVLNGPRQVGKTSLLTLLQNNLKKQGVSSERIFYLNLEKIEILDNLNKNPENLLKYITDKKQKAFFFIDEIQYLDNPSNFLKLLYDEHRDKIKLIVTGSSSLELKAKFQDSLAGRKITFSISPLCFEEFLQFQKEDDILRYYQHKDLPVDIQNKFKEKLDEYLLFGGMPKVILTEDTESKKELLQNYINDYINKDIRYIGKIDSILKFNQLIKILAGQIGNLLNINELSNSLDVPRREVVSYLELMEYTFVLFKTVPFTGNLRSQITKMPKFYFFDLGIRNQILDNFTALDSRTDSGCMFENFAYLEIKQSINTNNIHFYRTVYKTEVDFVFEKDGVVFPIEVKYKSLRQPKGEKVLSSFCEKNGDKCPISYLINLNLNEQKGKIKFIPFVNFIERILRADT